MASQLKAEFSVEQVAALRKECVENHLENAEILSKYSDLQLVDMFNGIGTDSFPTWMEETIELMNPHFGPAAMIHDVEWTESDGTRASFRLSNDRLARNGVKQAKVHYPWYSPVRYIMIINSEIMAEMCQMFGFGTWQKHSEGKSGNKHLMIVAYLFRGHRQK